LRFAWIESNRRAWPVTVMCRVLNVSCSGFYAWQGRPRCCRAIEDERLTARIVATFQKSRETYGSPRVHAELRAEGSRVSRKRVERLMRVKALRARRRRKFVATTDSRHGFPIAPNLVARDFKVGDQDRVWAGDVTAIWTRDGWLFLAHLMDLFSRRIVGWEMSEANDTNLALGALRSAVRRRQPLDGLVHHTDRGSPYASREYRQETIAFGMVRSMSRKGDCWDNAVSESFFKTIRAELIDPIGVLSMLETMRAIEDWIENFYNPTRRHSYLGYLSPVEFELRHGKLSQVA
jgi:transposase InsO family protein